MSRATPFVAVAAAALCALPAQRKLEARDVLLPDCQNLIAVDFAAAREAGVWEDLEVSVLKLAFGNIEREIGFALADLDRFQVSVAFAEAADDARALSPRNTVEVRVFEGNRPLALHESYRMGGWAEERIGDFVVLHRDNHRDELLVQPRPEMLIQGSTSALRPVLEGKRAPALPAPEVMSLLSGRDRGLAWMVLGVGHPQLRERFLGTFMGADTDQWPEDDRPTHLCVQIVATGDPDDPHVAVQAALRHRAAGAGVAVSAKAAAAFVERLRDDERFRLLRPLLKDVEPRVDKTDAILRLDLGRSRHAVGHLATLLLPMLMRDGAPGEKPAIKEAAPADEEPAPVKPGGGR